MMRTGMTALLMILIMICSTSMTGCWNLHEPEDLAVVLATAFDYDDEKGLFNVIVQLANPLGSTTNTGEGTTEKHKSFEVLSAYGKTPFEAMQSLGQISCRMVFWGHNRVILFSEKMARHGIKEALDVIERRRLTRLTARPAVIRGDIRKLMEAECPFEETGAEGLEKLIATVPYEKSVINTNLFIDLYNTLEEPGKEMFMGKIKVREEENCAEEEGSASAEVGGGAIFKGDRMVGWASQQQTEGWLYALERGFIFNINIECPGSDGEYIAIEISKPKSSMVPTGSGREVGVRLKVNARGSVEDISCYKNVMDRDFRLAVERRSAQVIRNRISDMIRKSQELESDICGFGYLIYRKRPDIWKEIGADWDEIFPHLPVDLDVRFKLIRSGLVENPLKMGR
ncbi:MAG: Ger(x)C family spore germination protein [Firmicutes bacterium]|nr:Ger(x)C family spore germination protein [Bacillota bacterium]